MNHLVRMPWRAASGFHQSGAWNTDTVPEIIRRQARRWPDKTAVVDASGRTTYAQIASALERAAAVLASQGVDRGDAVLVREPDSAAFIVASAAAHAVGAVAVPVAPAAGEVEVASIVERVRPCAHAGAPVAWPCLRELWRLDVRDRSIWEPGGAPVGLDKPVGLDPPDADALMEIMFTSGTTGRAKGVMNSANTKLAGVRGMLSALDLDTDDVIGVVAPMHHNAGWGYSCLLGLYCASTVVCVGRGDPVRMLDVLATEKVTATFLVPTHAADLLGASAEEPERWGLALRYVLLGGSNVPPRLARAVRTQWGAEPIVCYGMTETQAVSFTRPGDPIEVITGTVGRTCPGVELALRDPGTGMIEDASGGAGEVVTRGPTVCLGYYDDQAGTDAAFTKDGWLRHGDLGEFVGQELRISGRMKDVILRGGATIAPNDVEAALSDNDGVSDVAVCSLPDERLGEVVCACVIGTATLEDLHDHLRRRGIGRALWPDIAVRLERLPRNDLGKVLRNELSAIAAALV